MQAKLNPYNDAKISFPGFQRILDFTATGAESTKSVAVDGDTDKEYRIVVRNLGASSMSLRLNGDTGSKYGSQNIVNNGGSIAAARVVTTYFTPAINTSIGEMTLLTPSGFIKTGTSFVSRYTTGTTMDYKFDQGVSFNETANITSLDFFDLASAAWTAGTRITVYARRSQS